MIFFSKNRHRRVLSATLSRRLLGLLAAFLSSHVVLEPKMAAAETGAAACDAKQGEPHAIVRAGDATSVVLDDGREVRLAGILFPPAPIAVPIKNGTWEPEQAARRALIDALASGAATVSEDATTADRYGRTSAQIHVTRADSRTWLQRELVEQGHAIVSSKHGGGACLATLLAAENQARVAKLGLWSHASYQVKPATEPRGLLRLQSNFAIVEGVVVNVTERSGRLFLNFGDDWRGDFTAVVPAHVLKASPESKARLQSATGRKIRVRGWLQRRYGPSIEVIHAGDIEDAGAAPPAAAPMPLSNK
jgi:micrococcal nuclease